MVEFVFNFIGIPATDFHRAFRFYTDTVGIRPALPNHRGDVDSWAMLVDGWEDSPGLAAKGLRCELFEQEAEAPEERWWGHHQNARPSMLVADIHGSVAALQANGVPFTANVRDTHWGQTIEFTAPEGIRWSLAQTDDLPAAAGVETPYLGYVELKVADLDRQLDFYTNVLGLSVGAEFPSGVHLEQATAAPLLILEHGGESVSGLDDGRSPFAVQPVWLSFETPDIVDAKDWLKANGPSLHRDIETQDWGGSDLIVQDPDGNPLQVVEYHDS